MFNNFWSKSITERQRERQRERERNWIYDDKSIERERNWIYDGKSISLWYEIFFFFLAIHTVLQINYKTNRGHYWFKISNVYVWNFESIMSPVCLMVNLELALFDSIVRQSHLVKVSVSLIRKLQAQKSKSHRINQTFIKKIIWLKFRMENSYFTIQTGNIIDSKFFFFFFEKSLIQSFKPIGWKLWINDVPCLSYS